MVAKGKVTTLSMHQRRLRQLMNSDPQLTTLIYRNVMFMMREKLIASNERIAELIEAQAKA